MIEKMKLFEDKSDKLKSIDIFASFIMSSKESEISSWLQSNLKNEDYLHFEFSKNHIKDDKFNVDTSGDPFNIVFVYHEKKGTRNGQLHLIEDQLPTIALYVDSKLISYGKYSLKLLKTTLNHELIHLYQLNDGKPQRSSHIRNLESVLETLGLSEEEIDRCEYKYRPFEMEAFLNEYIGDEAREFVSDRFEGYEEYESKERYNKYMNAQTVETLVELFLENEPEFEDYLYLYDDRIRNTKVITYIRKKFEKFFLTILSKSFNTKEIQDYVKSKSPKNGVLYRMINNSLVESFLNSIIS